MSVEQKCAAATARRRRAAARATKRRRAACRKRTVERNALPQRARRQVGAPSLQCCVPPALQRAPPCSPRRQAPLRRASRCGMPRARPCRERTGSLFELASHRACAAPLTQHGAATWGARERCAAEHTRTPPGHATRQQEGSGDRARAKSRADWVGFSSVTSERSTSASLRAHLVRGCTSAGSVPMSSNILAGEVRR